MCIAIESAPIAHWVYWRIICSPGRQMHVPEMVSATSKCRPAARCATSLFCLIGPPQRCGRHSSRNWVSFMHTQMSRNAWGGPGGATQQRMLAYRVFRPAQCPVLCSAGKCYIVGAGPGPADLLTVNCRPPPPLLPPAAPHPHRAPTLQLLPAAMPPFAGHQPTTPAAAGAGSRAAAQGRGCGV